MPTDKISSEALLTAEDEDGYDEGSVNGSIGQFKDDSEKPRCTGFL